MIGTRRWVMEPEKGPVRPGKAAYSSGHESRLRNRAPRAQDRALRSELVTGASMRRHGSRRGATWPLVDAGDVGPGRLPKLQRQILATGSQGLLGRSAALKLDTNRSPGQRATVTGLESGQGAYDRICGWRGAAQAPHLDGEGLEKDLARGKGLFALAADEWPA